MPTMYKQDFVLIFSTILLFSKTLKAPQNWEVFDNSLKNLVENDFI